MLQEKRFYLEQLKNGPCSHRLIMSRMASRFECSVAAVRDELIEDGLIVLHSKKRIGATSKHDYFFKLTKKKFVVGKQQIEVPKQQVHVVEDCWPDGQPKSLDNAFNWRNKEQGLYSKRELVVAQQKYHNNSQITVYSRA